MFDTFEGPKWLPRRPERSGIIAICLFFFMTAAISFAEKRFFVPAIALRSSDSTQLLEHHDRHSGKVQVPDVEIRSLRPATHTPARKHPRQCRCHIDTRGPQELIHHHSSEFGMCNVITDADKQWRKGYFAGEAVEMRWHCTGE
jgi:hypothetical protein